MRSVADWNPARVRECLTWPLRDVLLAYVNLLRRDAKAQYYEDLAVWAALAPHTTKRTSPPKLPRILKS